MAAQVKIRTQSPKAINQVLCRRLTDLGDHHSTVIMSSFKPTVPQAEGTEQATSDPAALTCIDPLVARTTFGPGGSRFSSSSVAQARTCLSKSGVSDTRYGDGSLVRLRTEQDSIEIP